MVEGRGIGCEPVVIGNWLRAEVLVSFVEDAKGLNAT